jgi:hypothetical protein
MEFTTWPGKKWNLTIQILELTKKYKKSMSNIDKKRKVKKVSKKGK